MSRSPEKLAIPFSIIELAHFKRAARQLFLCPPATGTIISHNKFTLGHVKLTMYTVTYPEIFWGYHLYLKFPVILSSSKLLFFCLDFVWAPIPHPQYQNLTEYVAGTYKKTSLFLINNIQIDLIFSGNPKKSQTDQVYYNLFYF